MNWWIAAAVFVLLVWPHIVLFRTASLREEELIPVAAHYRGINSQNAKYVILYVLTIGLVSIAFIGLIAASLPIARQLAIGFACLLVSSYSMYQASFAIRYGVMPNSKYFGSKTTYWYSGSGTVQRVAIGQIAFVFVLLVAVSVYTIAFW